MSSATSGESALRRSFRRLPAWLRVVTACAAIGLGATLLIRPTTSLGVLAALLGAGLLLIGILELGDTDRSAGAGRLVRARPLIGILSLVAGLVILLAPGLTVRAVAVLVAVALIGTGAVRVLGVFDRDRTADERIARGAFGLATVVFGVLALLWPDITLLVVGALFGAYLIAAGLLVGWRAVRGRRAARADHTERRAGPFARWTRTVGAVVVLALAMGGAAVSAAVRGASPVVDAFYAPPLDVPDEPGALLRAEPFTRGVPEGARAWRILYTTTAGDGSPSVASGLVIVPDGVEAPPVVDWAHGTTGFAQNCAPSLLEDPFGSGGLFVLPEILEHGWAVVATDYIGLGTAGPHPYLIGADSGKATLDALRAARSLEDADLGTQSVLWGHSQGGGAALWAAALAEEYAPELRFAGVAAMAPAANLPGLVDTLDEVPGGSVFASFVASAYTAIYPEVRFSDYIRPGAQVIVRQMAERCLSEPGTLVSILTLLGLSQDPDIFRQPPGTGPLAVRLEENIPPGTDLPLLLGQGAADSLIRESVQRDYVERLCSDGRSVDYRTYPGLDHLPLVEPGSPAVDELFAWTADRFAGTPVRGAAGCD